MGAVVFLMAQNLGMLAAPSVGPAMFAAGGVYQPGIQAAQLGGEKK